LNIDVGLDFFLGAGAGGAGIDHYGVWFFCPLLPRCCHIYNYALKAGIYTLSEVIFSWGKFLFCLRHFIK
jgi:hypothetical protein